MRIAILSDIHANAVALETVLALMGSVDQIWNLGDTIGYGPRPNECMAAMQTAQVMIAGNHDLGSIERISLKDFNLDARLANLWNGQQLEPQHRARLEELPPAAAVSEQCRVAHGSPRDPVWEYLLYSSQARDNFALFSEQICWIGHSHVPLLFRLRPDGSCDDPALPPAGETVELRPDERYIINPGSVGQPRNHDPRAAYAIFDTDAATVRFNRVEYDIAKTQQQMREAQLPLALIQRLSYGM
jgi:predicted phosphodiesterase